MPELNSVADARQREQALDSSKSWIVQAPAGSGKTGLLTQRYLGLLAKVSQPEEVLAITFTRKAAAEMRARVLAALTAARNEPRPESSYLAVTWDLARQVCTRDGEKNWDIGSNPSRLRILTIDALCASLTRQMPLSARFGAMPEIVEDPRELYRQAAHQTILELESTEDWSESIRLLVDHLDNNLLQIQSLIVTMLARRDQWLRYVAEHKGSPIARERLEYGLRRAVESELAALADLLPAELDTSIRNCMDFAAANIADSNSAIVAWQDQKQLPVARIEDLKLWQGLASLLLTGEGKWRARLDARLGFPPATSVKDKAASEHLKSMKKRCTDLIAELSEVSGMRERLAAVPVIPPACYSSEQWQILSALFEFLVHAVAQLEVVFSSSGCVDFIAVSQAAVKALGESEQPTDLALSLDYRVQHILIDEFQDTSLSQFQLLEKLTAGWNPGDGRTLFAVGDPMQSIYRFREADVGLYLRATEHGVGSVQLNYLQLSVNFRSEECLIDWINDCFKEIFPKNENAATGAVVYAESIPDKPTTHLAPVKVHPVLGDDKALEAAQIAAVIEHQLKTPGDIGLLVRSRTHLLQLLPLLRKRGIDFQAVEIESLADSQIVQDLMTLVRAMHQPEDRLAWLSLLRAPWCGLELKDILSLIENDSNVSLSKSLFDPDRWQTLSEDGRERVSRLKRILELGMQDQHRLPLRQWIEGIWLALGGPAMVREIGELEDARVFLEMLETLEQTGRDIDQALIYERAQELFLPPDSRREDIRVKVMTIHKAKGLEFDWVIVPGLGRGSPPPEQKLLVWQELSGSQSGSDMLIAPIRKSGDEQQSLYRYIGQLDRAKGLQENVRVLYVAATRARKGLHLIGHVKLNESENEVSVQPPAKGTLLEPLWPMVSEHYESAMRDRGNFQVAIESQSFTPPQKNLRRYRKGWQVLPPPEVFSTLVEPVIDEDNDEDVTEFLWAGETVRHIGTLVHRQLQLIAQSGVENFDIDSVAELKDRYKILLENWGVPEASLDSAVAKVLKACKLIIEDERGRWILSSKHQDAHAEFALTGILDSRRTSLIIDRTFIDENGFRWIIDYKSGTHQGSDIDIFLDNERERYRSQLEKYGQLMCKYGDEPIKYGMYFPLMQGWRSWS